MARRRMIDPNFWASQDVAKLTHRQRLLAIGLFSIADDEGRGIAHPAYIRSQVFPYDDISLQELEEDLQIIQKHLSIRFYVVGKDKYYAWLNWKKWQTVNRPQKSLLPPPAEEKKENNGSVKGSRIDHGSISDQSMNESVSKPGMNHAQYKGKEFNIKEGEDGYSNDHVTLDPPRENSGNQQKDADDADEGKIFQLFENELCRPITPLEVDQINAWLSASGPDLTKEALRRAVLQGKLSFRYIDKILLGWQKQNLRTLREVAEKDPLDRESRAAGQNGGVTADPQPRADPEKERRQWVQAAIQYIRSTIGEKPDREKARRIAEGYGPDVAAEVMRILFGGDGHGKLC